MRILICSYEYGKNGGPEGICTQRFCEALNKNGATVYVLTSKCLIEYEKCEIITVSNKKNIFETILEKYVLKGNINQHYFWVRKACQIEIPDVDIIYGRGLPYSSITLAFKLALLNKKTLFVHFSDPIPSPWQKKRSISWLSEIWSLKKLIKKALLVSFTTQEAITYMNELIKCKINNSIVIKHVATSRKYFTYNAYNESINIVYIGSFYPQRNAKTLINGFALHLKKYSKSKLIFVGSKRKYIDPFVTKWNIDNNIVIADYTSDVNLFIKRADVLVAIDSFEGMPCFLSTKLIEYLMVNRKVLLISPEKSPGSKLTKNMYNVKRCDNDPKDVENTLNNFVQAENDDDKYENRMAQMSDFYGENIIHTFMDNINKYSVMK